ncbi:MAG: hypothetical protein Q8R01_09125 [Ramlibacter sp.]|nr:hypothetical protein [Ramlibacter sp.]
MHFLFCLKSSNGILSSLARRSSRASPAEVRVDRYIDNIRWTGNRDAVARSFAAFQAVCAKAGATVKPEPTINEAHQRGTFLGLECDYKAATTRLTSSFAEKLHARAIAVLAEDGDATVLDLLSLFGLLVFASRAERLPLAAHFWAICFARRRSSEVANGTRVFSSRARMWRTSMRWVIA